MYTGYQQHPHSYDNQTHSRFFQKYAMLKLLPCPKPWNTNACLSQQKEHKRGQPHTRNCSSPPCSVKEGVLHSHQRVTECKQSRAATGFYRRVILLRPKLCYHLFDITPQAGGVSKDKVVELGLRKTVDPNSVLAALL